jgi:hypothetical protein
MNEHRSKALRAARQDEDHHAGDAVTFLGLALHDLKVALNRNNDRTKRAECLKRYRDQLLAHQREMQSWHAAANDAKRLEDEMEAAGAVS